VDFNIDNLAAAAPNIKAGKLKALAVTSLAASPCCPACRRCRAASRFCHRHLVGPGGPAGTPGPVIARLNKAFTDALQAPETKTRFKALMAEPVPTTPEQFDAFMAAERANTSGGQGIGRQGGLKTIAAHA
jgi:tripartite-type tricarboxylate transporter receptor subunit TctC